MKEKELPERFREQGTIASGFASDGPYHCEDCIHRLNDHCFHPVVMADPQLASRKRKSDGYIKIDIEKECCRFVHPPAGHKAKKDDDDKVPKIFKRS